MLYVLYNATSANACLDYRVAVNKFEWQLQYTLVALECVKITNKAYL